MEAKQSKNGAVQPPKEDEDAYWLPKPWFHVLMLAVFAPLFALFLWTLAPSIVSAIMDGGFRSFTRAVLELQHLGLILFAFSVVVASGAMLFTSVAKKWYFVTSWLVWIACLLASLSLAVIVITGILRGAMHRIWGIPH